MSVLPRELHNVLNHPEFAAPVNQVQLTEDFGDETSTRTAAAFVVPRDMEVITAKLVQDDSPDGAKTLKVRNLTQSEDVTSAEDSDALSADTAASLTVNNGDVSEDDVLALVYTVNTAGTTGPGAVTVALEVQLMD